MKPTRQRRDEAAARSEGTHRPRSWIARTKPDLSIRFFSSATDAARVRRPTDVVLFVLSVAGLALVSLFAPDRTAIDETTSRLVKDLPGLLGWFWEIAHDLLLVWPLVLLIASVVARHRLFLLRDQVLGGAFAFGVVTLIADGWSAMVDGLTRSDPPPTYPAVRVAIATALIVTTSPHLGRPVRRVGRWVIGLGGFAGIALGLALPLGVVAGFAIGIGSAALVHLVFGSPGGLPSLDQVRAALEELGVEVSNLRQAELQPRGVALLRGEGEDGRAMLVKVYGRDAWDGQLLTSTWEYLWYRDESPSVTLSRRQQVEHEAFVTLLAERSGVPVLPVVAAGVAGARDGVLVIEADARLLDGASTHGPTDRLLEQLWAAVSAMHESGIAHGALDAQHIVVAPNGSPRLADFQTGSASAKAQAVLADRAQLLVTTALLAGDDRAVSAAMAAIGDDGLAEVLPYLQPAALTHATRRSLKDAQRDLDAIRDRAAAAAGTEPPKLEPLRRVTIGSLATIVLLLAAAYFVFTAIANVGIDQVVEELEKADAAWLWAALAVVPVVPVAQAFGTIGASTLPLRLGPVIALEYAVQFIALAVPSSAARVAMNVRFFQKEGAPAAQALTIGLIDSVFGFIVQVLILVTILVSGLVTLDISLDGLNVDPNGKLLVLASVLLLVVIVVALTIPRIRNPIRARVAEARPALRAIRSPVKLAGLLGGNLTAQFLLAIVLGLTVRAFGESATMAQLLLTNTLVSLFAGIMPVPGGIGVSEAALAFCLTAIGVPSASAAAIALTYRLLTFYLPPIWGGFAMRWLRRQSYL
jgi:uncharacterized membrane protein YbhN (UPF0104 family)/tRNA A-37 threonylcarbamoyl transferase component Bud32